MPKKIFYCVDFHCPAGGMLGYDGGAGGRLGGRRRPGGYLRESDSPMSDILTAFKELPEELKKDVEQIATSPDGAVVVKHKNGEFTMVEDGKVVMERVSADEVKKSGKLGQKQVTVMTKDELSKMLSERDDADPEQMMKEFVEKKRKCGVKEDEYRRPKNQPHNLHQVDEGEDVDESEDVEEDEYRRPKNQPHNLHQVDEGEDKDKIKIIGEISKTELAGWTGSNFAVAFGGYSLQDFKRDIDSFPGAIVQTLTDKPVRYC